MLSAAGASRVVPHQTFPRIIVLQIFLFSSFSCGSLRIATDIGRNLRPPRVSVPNTIDHRRRIPHTNCERQRSIDRSEYHSSRIGFTPRTRCNKQKTHRTAPHSATHNIGAVPNIIVIHQYEESREEQTYMENNKPKNQKQLSNLKEAVKSIPRPVHCVLDEIGVVLERAKGDGTVLRIHAAPVRLRLKRKHDLR